MCDEIVNLGDFWRSDKLRESGGEIKRIIDEKRGNYTRAYAYLHAAEQLEGELQRIYGGALLGDKLTAAAARITASCCRTKPGDSSGKLLIRPVEAFTAGGVRSFDTYAEQAETRLYIRDERGIGYLFLRAVIKGAGARGETILLSFDPYSGKRERAVYLPDCSTAIVPYRYDEHGYGDGDKIINMERFIDSSALKPYKNGLRFTKRYRDLLYNGAIAELDANKALHTRLEEIYGGAMDFGCKEEFTKRLLVKIFS